MDQIQKWRLLLQVQVHELAEQEKFDNELFKDLEYYVFRNLTDTFRLMTRNEYKSFKSAKQLIKEINIGE